MLDPRVRTFLTACDTLSFTRAAQELHITQPAVSQQIAYLEHEYGAPLFERAGRSLRLTPAGQLVRDALAAMAHDEGLLRERVQSVARGTARPLRVGMTMTAGRYVVGSALGAWLGEHPETRMSVTSADTAALLGQLRTGELDCAFVEGFFDAGAFACDALCREELICVAAPGLEVPRGLARFEDLLGVPLLVREPGSGTRAVLEHALAARNLSLSSFADVSEIGSLEVLKLWCRQGLGMAFLYRAAVEGELADGTLRQVPLAEQPITHDIAFVRLPDSVFEPEFAALFSAIRKAKSR